MNFLLFFVTYLLYHNILMKELGAEQVFIDRMSGKNTDRPELKIMMSFVREGDTVIAALQETQRIYGSL